MKLPKPKLAGGKTVNESLRLRKTTREISDEPLPIQELSNVLWAACGVNRRNGPFDGRGITAASASNSQEISVYVALAKGAYRYDAAKHELVSIAASDLRALTLSAGQPNPSPKAPVQLIYAVDLHRLTHTTGFEEPGLHDPEVQKSYYFVDTGLIAGNVYVYAASRGLACWFHNCQRVALAKKLKLGKEQRVLFAQTIGHHAK